ncbi:MAG TPA: sigma 54-interacting transcriptional regulator, partial [Pseudomonadota bacterium]|nr:sigma 54-interacting transcriptional regulator [Pseudomonadota bacterium]
MLPSTLKETEDLLQNESEEPGSPGLVLCFSGNRPYLLPFSLRDGSVTIGRDELERQRIQDDRLSRRHIVVERTRDGSGLQICDLGSTNGVFLNGERLLAHTTTVAPPRAILRIGRTLLLVVPELAPYQAALDRPLLQGGIVIGPTLHAIHKQVAALAKSGQGLFLRGESGVGKEITARLYHQSSPRRAGPLVAINGATIPKELAERLLFGAVRGAYSGAVADVSGYLQAANGGTLFLDEVAELDLAVQAKLLRVLETREVVPLGGTRPQVVELGVCAATLRDLGAAVAAGSFRQDLYYRIGRPEVYVPPLRERLEEIPYLVSQTVEKAGRTASAPLVEACLLRPWPGNVRELCAEVQAAASLAAAEGSETVLPRHLLEQAGRRITGMPVNKTLVPLSAPEPAADPTAALGPPEGFLRAAC